LDSLEGSIEEQRPLGYNLSAIFGQNFRDGVRFSNPVGQAVMWWAQSANTGWNRVN